MLVKAQASPFPTAEKLRCPASLSRPGAWVVPAKSEQPSRLGEQINALRIALGKTGGARACRAVGSLKSAALARRARVGVPVGGDAQPNRRGPVRLAFALLLRSAQQDLSLVRTGHGIVVDCIGAVENYRYELEPSSMSNVVDTKET